MLDYLGEEVNIGIVTYDNFTSFYQAIDGEITVFKNIDKDNLSCPLSSSDLFLNVRQSKDQIILILEYLRETATTLYNEYLDYLQNKQHCLQSFAENLKTIF